MTNFKIENQVTPAKILSMDHILFKKLSVIVGKEHCTNRTEDLHCYSFDGSKNVFMPEAVVFPGNSSQVSQILALCSDHHLPVTVRGAGTGMTGGALPVTGGLVMAMSRMNRIIEIDPANQIGIVEPGVITADLQQQAKKYSLAYPPDPASLKFCTLGGNVAECAGGPSAVKYGVTKDYIIGLELVLASGDIITTGVRTEKGVTGYDLTRLFIGSEGTLAVITKIIVRLIPLPEYKQTFLLQSSSLHDITTLVSGILISNITPCTIEYMDRTAIQAVSHLLPGLFPSTIQAVLLVELDGSQTTVDRDSKKLIHLVEKVDTIEIHQAGDAQEAEELWQARRSISPAVFKLNPNKISEDVVVPRSKISDLVDFTEQLGKDLDLTILTFGHAGDGNIHVNIMYDASDPIQTKNSTLARERLFRFVIDSHGSLSGEHGIGITKSSFLPLEIDQTTMDWMKKVKSLFDPDHILNPGKIFPE